MISVQNATPAVAETKKQFPIRTVRVRFQSDRDDFRAPSTKKLYSYLCDIQEPIAVGGYAVVKTPENTYHVVRIEEVEEGRGPAATKFLIDLVDVSGAEARLKREKDRAAVLQQLREKQKKVDEISMFERLASQDPEARELLEQLKALS